VRILVVGGGPAGLSFACLMAETDSPHEITLIERNAAHVRPGFGITLRNDAISFLGLDKCLSYQRLEGRTFWRRGEVIVDLPNPPEAHLVTISRAELITTLANRCSRNGVRLRYENDIAQLRQSDLNDFDLVVGADGAYSTVRRIYDHAFAPVVEYARNRYGWFGAAILFSKLTIMLNDDHRAMLAWAYRYTESLSTVIVECSESAFEAYGINDLSPQQTMAKVGDIFVSELKGGSVFCGNVAPWPRFPMVSCAKLHYLNVVLIGDAAHTTHFSQGFGTMFAFDDSLALCSALAAAKDVSTALEAYEAAQRPKISQFQETSFGSMRWSERLIDAAEQGDERKVRELIATRWPKNKVLPGPLGSNGSDSPSRASRQ